MPLYDVKCSKCGTTSEVYSKRPVSHGEDFECPACGDKAAVLLPTRFAFSMGINYIDATAENRAREEWDGI